MKFENIDSLYEMISGLGCSKHWLTLNIGLIRKPIELIFEGEKSVFFASGRETFAVKRVAFASERETFASERETFAMWRVAFASKRETFANERVTFAI